jgi:hypothetical protein
MKIERVSLWEAERLEWDSAEKREKTRRARVTRKLRKGFELFQGGRPRWEIVRPSGRLAIV